MALSDQQLMEIANGKSVASSFTDEDLIRIAGKKTTEPKPISPWAFKTPFDAPLPSREDVNRLRSSEPTTTLPDLAPTQPQPAQSTGVTAQPLPQFKSAYLRPPSPATMSQKEPSTLESLNAAGAGLVSGALSPITGDPQQVGATQATSEFDQWVKEARTASPDVFSAGAFGGDIAAFSASQMLGGKLLPEALGKLPALAQKIVKGATTGAVYETAQQGGKALNDQEVDLSAIPKTALLFGAGDAALHGLGKLASPLAEKALPEATKVAETVSKPESIVPKTGKASSVELGSGITPELVKDLLTTVESGGKWVGSKVPEKLRRVTEAVETPEAKAILNEGMDVAARAAEIEGKPLEDMRKLGFFRKLFKKSKASWAETADLLRSDDPSVAPIRKILDDIHTAAQKVGFDVGKREGYFPQIVSHSYADSFKSDFTKIIEKVRLGKDLPESAYEQALSKSGAKTQEFVAELKKKMGSVSTKDAVTAGIEESVPGVVGKSRFMRQRPYELDAKFLENDPRIVLPQYVSSMSRSIAAAEKWGVGGEKLQEKLKVLGEKNYNDQQIVTDVVDAFSGKYQAGRQFGRGVQSAIDIHRNFFITPKLLTATIPNILQTSLNTMQRAGIYNTGAAWLKVLKPSTRSALRIKGIGDQDIIMSILGHESAGLGKGFTEGVLSAIQFRGINRLNLYVSALAGERAMQTWIKNAAKDGVRGSWARNNLKRLGIDPTKKLTESEMNQKMFRFAQDTQLMKNVFQDPLFMSDPRMAAFLALKTFGIRMATSQKDIILKDAVIHDAQGRVVGYNVRPLLQLATAGVFGGELASWAKGKIAEAVGGEPRYDKDDRFKINQMVEHFTQAGATGIAFDAANTFYEAVSSQPSSAVDKAWRVGSRFAPVIAADFVNAFGNAVNFASYWNKYDSPVAAARKVAPNALGVLGPIPKALGLNLQTDAQALARVKGFRSREKGEIEQDVLGGNIDRAIRRMELWNQHYQSSPILWGEPVDGSPATYINVKGVIRKQVNQTKSKIDAGAE